MTDMREALDTLRARCAVNGMACGMFGQQDFAKTDIAAAEAAVMALYDKALAWKGVAGELAEALEGLMSEQNGPRPPLYRHKLEWQQAMAATRTALADYNKAKEGKR